MSVRFCISLCFKDCNDKILIKIKETFIKFCKYCYSNQLMFITFFRFKDFSGGGTTIRVGALIRKNKVFRCQRSTVRCLIQDEIPSQKRGTILKNHVLNEEIGNSAHIIHASKTIFHQCGHGHWHSSFPSLLNEVRNKERNE